MPEDRFIYALVPHMHLRGKAFRFTAVYPDNRKEILLDVPRYDFNWQNIYRLAEPKLLPDGTRLQCEAVFDNSENNLLNPDPTSSVHWGDQTWDEMMVGSYDYSPAEQDFSIGPPRHDAPSGWRLRRGLPLPADRHVPVNGVYLAGTFNDWKPESGRMAGPDKEGWFTRTLRLPMGRYQYKYDAVGQGWRSDPGNIAQVGIRPQQRARGRPALPPQGHPPRRRHIRRHVSLSAANIRENRLPGRDVQRLEADGPSDARTRRGGLVHDDDFTSRGTARIQIRRRWVKMDLRSRQSGRVGQKTQ